MTDEIKQQIIKFLFDAKLDSVANIVSQNLQENDFQDENFISFLASFNDYRIKSSLGNYSTEQEISVATEIAESILAKIRLTEKNKFEAKNIDESEAKHFELLISKNRMNEFFEILFKKIHEYPNSGSK